MLPFFHAHVCVCHFSIAARFLIILGALKRRAQRRFDASKIIRKLAASSELSPSKELHVEGILKSRFWMILQIYYRESYYDIQSIYRGCIKTAIYGDVSARFLLVCQEELIFLSSVFS